MGTILICDSEYLQFLWEIPLFFCMYNIIDTRMIIKEKLKL